MAGKKSRQGIWKTYFAEKKAELFQRGYAMLDVCANALKILTDVLNVMERLPSLFVELLQTMFDLVLPTFHSEEVQKKYKTRNLCNQIVNRGVESTDK